MNRSLSTRGCVIFVIMLILLIVGAVCLEVFALMLLWNWLAPLFWANAPVLTFLQTLGIAILLNIIGGLLFKSNTIKS